MENEMGRINGGGDLFSLMMGVLKDGVIDIDGLAVEFSRLVGLLRPEESEEVIVSACRNLSRSFTSPSSKIVFITQRWIAPLMELLEVPKTRVCRLAMHCILLVSSCYESCSFKYEEIIVSLYFRVIFSRPPTYKSIVKDNTDFHENACLVGLG
ncbi:hypothetical protein OIU84_018234, partial [Salix udensis]